MKIFYWDDVLRDYTSGIMVAVAPTLEEAKEALLKKCSYIPKEDLDTTPKVIEIGEPVGFICWGGG